MRIDLSPFSALRLAVCLMLLGPGLSQPAAAETRPLAAERIAQLQPGQFLWQPVGTEGPVEIVIGLPEQRAYVYRSGRLIGASTISSGKPGRESPVGRFQILQKRAVHRSNRYDDAPMPYMQRLNWYGVALHGGAVPGYPASHGCIRLPMAFAKRLFQLTELGGFVFVSDQPLPPPGKALKLARRYASAPLPPDRMLR